MARRPRVIVDGCRPVRGVRTSGRVLEVVGNWQRAEQVDGEALVLAEELDDGLWRASCQTATAEVMRKRGRYNEALELIGAADALREAIGAPRAPSLEEEIKQQIDPAVAALSEQDCVAHRARGRSLTLAAAVDHALALCER